MIKLLSLSIVGLTMLAPSCFAASGASCSSTGSVSVASTINVTNSTYDGGCKTFNGTSALGDGSQNESQKAYFKVTNGTVKNVILGKNGADGIHMYGNSSLNNVRWTDVGEDAMTIKSSGTVNVSNITGSGASDKFFQANAASTLNVNNAVINTALKAYRQNGGTGYTTAVTFTNVDLSNVGEAVFRTDASNSTARWASGKGSNVKSVCRGYGSGKCTVGSGVTGYSKLNY